MSTEAHTERVAARDELALILASFSLVALVVASLRGGGTRGFGSAARFALYALLILTSLTLFVGGGHHE